MAIRTNEMIRNFERAEDAGVRQRGGRGQRARGDGGPANDAPPRLTGGESTEIDPNNLAYEKLQDLLKTESIQEYEFFKTHITNEKGDFIEIPLRRGLKDSALIDQLTFTIHESSITKFIGYPLVSDNQYINAYSAILQAIFGFGVNDKLPFRGKFFYNSCYHLGPMNVQYGTLHYGGQRDTILIELNGTGCQAAKAGWESRLHKFLKQSIRPRITRVDVAHDFFHGEYTPEQAASDHKHGLFNTGGRNPKSETVGTAWREEDYTGKTFYVGRRGSAKYTRVYEKGRAFGDKSSEWVRFEVEFRAQKEHHIPLDILVFPGEHLSGAYPICESLFNSPARRIESVTKTVQITYEQRIYYARQQVGRLMNFLLDAGKDPAEICEMLRAEDGKYPKGLMPEQYDASVVNETYAHEYVAPDLDAWGMVNLPSLSMDTRSRPKPKGFEDLDNRDIDDEFNSYLVEEKE